MSDNVVNSTGVPIATDELATVNGVAQVAPLPQAQRMKVGYGGDGAFQDVDGSHGLPVNVVTGNITVGTVAIGDGADTTQGSTADAATSAGGTGSLSAKLRLLTSQMFDLIARFPASIGQKDKTASLSVVLAIDQPAIAVTGVVGGGAQFAEDAAHTSGDLGTMALAVRNDAGTVLAGTTGDYVPLTTDASGNLRVTSSPGGAQYAEDTAHTNGDFGILSLVVRKDVAGSLVSTDGDYGALQTDANGNLRVTGGGGGQQFAEDSAHVSGDLGTMLLAVRNDAGTALAGTTGDYIPVTTDASGNLRVVHTGALPAGTAILGKVGIDQTAIGTTDRVMAQSTVTILIAVNLATGGAYVAGDYVGPTGGLGVGVNPANRATGLGGHVESFTMFDQDNQGVPCDVYFFENSNWTSPADNAAWSITDTSAQYMVGRCAINSFVSYGAAGMAGFGVFAEGPIPYKCNGQTVYFAVVTRGAPTYTAVHSSTAGLQFRIGLVLD